MGLIALAKEVGTDILDALKSRRRDETTYEIAARNIDRAVYWQNRAEYLEREAISLRACIRELQSDVDAAQTQVLELQAQIGVLRAHDRDAA